MTLPTEFDKLGGLPNGVFRCSLTEFHQRFVLETPQTAHRQSIFDGFVKLHAKLAHLQISSLQWLDGSFVTTKELPGDIDLVSFVSAAQYNNFNDAERALINSLLDGKKSTKPTYSTETYLVLVPKVGDAAYPAYEMDRAYWRKWFGKFRDIHMPPFPIELGATKGIVEIVSGDSAKVPIVSKKKK